MIWPPDTPAWLRKAVDDLDESARIKLRNDEPARAAGYFSAIDELKEAITAEAESEQSRRKQQLAELTFPAEKGSN